MSTAGERLMARLDALARHTDEPGKLTRLYLSPSHKAAAAELSSWMREAGLSVSMDALGTVCGRYEGKTPNAPALLIGSHIDSVRDAGRYDGPLGVLSGLTVIEELARSNERFPFAIEVLAFGDEEGVRFPETFSGSRAIAGQFKNAALDGADANGITMRQALHDFGRDVEEIGKIPRDPRNVIGYLEAHIEQGPVLETEGLAVGAVGAINAVKRFTIHVKGEAGHAGTVPMTMRRDALAASAEMILAIETIAGSMPNVVGTVGRAAVAPGAVNVIPGDVTFTLDARAPTVEERDASVAKIEKSISEIAARRGVTATMTVNTQSKATAMSPAIVKGLLASIERQGIAPRMLQSGAGHDAMEVAALCPVGMLFVRCKGGISHNPAESITADDANTCVRVMLDFVRHLDMTTLRA